MAPKTVDYMSPERVILAGINYRIFAFVMCKHMGVKIIG
jgi:hypothetical protein